MSDEIDYQVYCPMCEWTGDREDFLSLKHGQCPDCGAPGVTLHPEKHPEVFAGKPNDPNTEDDHE